MGNHVVKKVLALAVACLFIFSSGLAFAEAMQWYVLKDKNGVCSVRQLKAKTDKTIAGPYATKQEATKAKEEKCPKPEKKKDEKKKP